MKARSRKRRLQASAAVVSPWYRKADLMAIFGVTDRTIEKWVSMGRLPEPNKQGRGWVRWPKTVIDALVLEWGKAS